MDSVDVSEIEASVWLEKGSWGVVGELAVAMVAFVIAKEDIEGMARVLWKKRCARLPREEPGLLVVVGGFCIGSF